MATVEDKLIVRMEASLTKIENQLARYRKVVSDTAQGSETRFAKAHERIKRGAEDAAGAIERVGRTSGAQTAMVQNFGYQIGDLATQISAGTSASRALSMQLPQMLGGFGAVGAAGGALAAVLGAVYLSMQDTANANDKLVESLTGSTGSLSSVRGDLEELARLQETYTNAILASGDASASSASAVVANSKREFNARREVLKAELELMRVRQSEKAAQITGLQDEMRSSVTAEMQRKTSFGGSFNTLDPSIQPYVYGGPRSVDDILGKKFQAENEQRLIALRKLKAETELTQLAIEEADAALSGTFADIEGGATSGGKPGSGGKGGGGGSGTSAAKSAAADRVAEVGAAIKQLNVTLKISEGLSESFRNAFGSAFTDFVTGAKSAEDAATNLVNSLAALVTNQAFETFAAPAVDAAFARIGGMFGGGLAPRTVNATLGQNPQFMSLFRSFDGGGFTGFGSRTGGVDGKGGFPAILHPNETVIDHSKGGGTGGAGRVVIELSPDLVARTLDQAARQSVQISGQTAAAQARGFGRAAENYDARGTSG